MAGQGRRYTLGGALGGRGGGSRERRCGGGGGGDGIFHLSAQKPGHVRAGNGGGNWMEVGAGMWGGVARVLIGVGIHPGKGRDGRAAGAGSVAQPCDALQRDKCLWRRDGSKMMVVVKSWAFGAHKLD